MAFTKGEEMHVSICSSHNIACKKVVSRQPKAEARIRSRIGNKLHLVRAGVLYHYLAVHGSPKL